MYILTDLYIHNMYTLLLHNTHSACSIYVRTYTLVRCIRTYVFSLFYSFLLWLFTSTFQHSYIVLHMPPPPFPLPSSTPDLRLVSHHAAYHLQTPIALRPIFQSPPPHAAHAPYSTPTIHLPSFPLLFCCCCCWCLYFIVAMLAFRT